MFFFEADSYESRIAQGLFLTEEDAKAAAAKYAYEQGLTNQPISWGGVPDRQSTDVGDDYIRLIITKMPVGVLEVHEDLDTFGEFEESESE